MKISINQSRWGLISTVGYSSVLLGPLHQLGVQRHPRRACFHRGVQEPHDHRAAVQHIGLAGQEAQRILYVLVVTVVDLLGQEEALFHGDAEVCHPLHFLAVVAFEGELGHPERIHILLGVLHHIVEH